MTNINNVTDIHAAAVANDMQNEIAGLQFDTAQRYADIKADVEAGTYRQRAAAQLVPAVNVNRDQEADSRERMVAAALHCMNSLANPNGGTPLLSTNREVTEIENAERKVTAIVERFYTGIGRKWLAVHFLAGADDDIRRIVDKAVEAYSLYFSNWIEGVGEHQFRSADVVIIASSRPQERYNCNHFGPDGAGYYNEIGYALSTLEYVDHVMSEDVHCDMDIYKGTELGSCKKHHSERLTLIAKCDGIGEDGKPNALRRKYLKENFFTVPFARGDMIVMVRICNLCWNGFLLKNSINLNTTEIIEPYTDGFGSVGSGTIKKSEYLWNHKIVDRAIQNLTITLRRNPTLQELENALKAETFIGTKG